jgi:hypothetical protein
MLHYSRLCILISSPLNSITYTITRVPEESTHIRISYSIHHTALLMSKRCHQLYFISNSGTSANLPLLVIPLYLFIER